MKSKKSISIPHPQNYINDISALLAAFFRPTSAGNADFNGVSVLKWLEEHGEKIHRPLDYEVLPVVCLRIGMEIEQKRQIQHKPVLGSHGVIIGPCATTVSVFESSNVTAFVSYNAELHNYFLQIPQELVVGWYKVDRGLLLPFTEAPIY